MCYCDPSNPFTGKSCGKEKCKPWECQEAMRELTAERDALKAELKATQSRLHEVAVGCANAEFELEATRNQEPAIYRLRYTEATSGWVDVTKEVYDRHKDSQNYDAKVFYASPVPAQQPAADEVIEFSLDPYGALFARVLR